MGDLTGVLVSLGGGISSGGKKSQESNIGDSDNTRDGGKTARGGIVTCGRLMASYACMTFIYGSSCKGILQRWRILEDMLKRYEDLVKDIKDKD
ncbi:hypothetical protein Tco_0564725 [Tanacetum coccineum]